MFPTEIQRDELSDPSSMWSLRDQQEPTIAVFITKELWIKTCLYVAFQFTYGKKRFSYMATF